MNFKFHDAYGREVRINDTALFAAYVRDGWIKADTLIYDEQTMLWKRAWELSEYHAASGGNPNQAGYAAPPVYGAPAASGPAYGAMPYGYAAPEEQSSGTWAIALGIILLCASLMMVMITNVKFSLSPYRAGYRIGVLVVATGLIGVVAFVISRVALKHRRGIGLLLFAIGVLGVSLFQSVAAYREGQLAKNAMENMASTYKQYLDGNPSAAASLDEKQYGEFAPAIKVINEYLQGEQSDTLEMNQEMTALHLENMLTRETLQDGRHINEGQQRVSAMREMLDRYEARLRRRADDIPFKINATAMDENQKREFLNGFNATKDRGLNDIKEFFEIERAIADNLEELLSFMATRQGRYRFTGSQVTFISPGDVSSYNRYLSTIRTVAQREDDWRMKMQQHGREQIEQMQKLMKR
jgi:hypothetical protein